MTFYEWLVRLKDRDTPTGDLAKDVLRDKEFPANRDNETVLRYLTWHATHRDVQRTVKTAWNSYRAYKKKRSDSE